MKRLLALLAIVPTHAVAQTPVPDAPTTLNPGATGDQTPPPRPPRAEPQPRSQVMVVGPDGKVTPQDEPEPSGYYATSGASTGDGGGQGGQGRGSMGGGFDEPTSIHAGPVPELHVVRKGDTLWDISFFYFNDPWQWPKVWSYNAQITNPHWIYPGDLVRLLPRGMFVQAGGGSPDDRPDGGGAQRPNDPVPAPATRTTVAIQTTAFVEKADLDQSIVIDGAVDEKELLTAGDQVYLAYPKNKTPQVGKRYSIYDPGRQVKGFGAYVKLLGTVEVLSVKEDKRARGVITDANYEIERGAKVGPLVKEFRNVPPVPSKVDAQGQIIAMLTHDQLIGQGEIVFVTLGKGSGIEVGNRMFVVRRGDAMPEIMSTEAGSDDRRFPARALGEIVIVEVGEKISMGLVTLSVQEMGVGDLVMMQKK
ncbi:MAG: LysM peptidoglycan-binding domain-containing protein [Deltaproteobacteria bacterium]|nr:LysM peptidoglycan-binding domain-containing protein [Deltaproteobacteria bacterium]MDQ3299620.1 LysM peptidoglycan-binding domain-containing protein [Myxococcota bacterium]